MTPEELQPVAHHRYHDHSTKKWATKILPGEFFITHEDEVIITILGSCIAACIYEPRMKVGGMNHFMLAESDTGTWAGSNASMRYGNFAMEHLINELLKKGCSKNNLHAKIYGGSQFSENKSSLVGDNNIAFVRNYLKTENIFIAEEDLGGHHSRKIIFHPTTGAAEIKKIDVTNHTIQQRDAVYKKKLEEEQDKSGDITLF